MDNIMLLGGSGFIGRNIIEALIDEDCQLIIIACGNECYDPRLSYQGRVKVIKGEISDLNLIETTIHDHNIGIVIHLVSSLIPASGNESFYLEMNNVVIPTQRVIDLLSAKQIKLVFFSSGGTIYGRSGSGIPEGDILKPNNNYGYSKLIIEQYILMKHIQEDLKYLILRPSNVYGKYQSLFGQQGFISVAIGKVMSGTPVIVWGDGSIVRDYIYIDDLAITVRELLKNNIWNEVLNIASGLGTSILQIIDIIQQCLNVELDILFKERRQVDIQMVVLSVDKLKSIIPFSPTDISTGIQKYIDILKIK